ncbi:MAG: NAD(P)/FAD-dependent oxidoreductase [Leptospiraceae bacterium]|nr:NAD(P)/FAD-dependent oxidoreductase [Leptospiraceae bacterium]
MHTRNSLSPDLFETIVIGTGLGSLSYAALAANKGKKVLVFEKAAEPGGCASSYTKNGIRYEAGATTLVGIESGLPINELMKELGISLGNLPLVILPKSMKVKMKDSHSESPAKEFIERNNNRSEWMQEVAHHFGERQKQKRFWGLMFFLSDHVWDVSSRLIRFPFRNLTDVLRTILKLKAKDIILFLFSLVRIESLLMFPGFPKSKEFKKFLDEQLLITVQTNSKKAPTTLASAGLTYAHLDNYYVLGGIGELARFLVDFIISKGGEVYFKEEIIEIQIDKKDSNILYSVLTRKNKTYFTTSIVSGIPIWNLPKLFENTNNPTQKKFHQYIKRRSNRYDKNIWGAFNISILMEDFLGDEDCIHFQFHLEEELPYGLGDSIFISLSHISDDKRCAKGQRVLAISTHAANPESWDRREDSYKNKKQEIISKVIEYLEKNWKGFSKDKILQIQAASPATWEVWTGRYQGRVGGIPASYFKNLLTYPSSFTPSKGFYLLGDTVYPGQGIPGVVLGALNLFKRLG